MNKIVLDTKATELEQLDNARLQELSTKELKLLLGQAVSVTARLIEVLANVWRILEDRGEDLSDMRTGIMRYLPLISSGKTDSSVVLKFAGQQVLMREIALLPNQEQKRLANGEKIPLVSMLQDGTYKTDFVDVASIHIRHYRQIFKMGEIRSEQEQKRWLDENSNRKKPRHQKVRKKMVHIDTKKNTLRCGTVSILLADVIASLAATGGKSTEQLADFLNLKIEE